MVTDTLIRDSLSVLASAGDGAVLTGAMAHGAMAAVIGATIPGMDMADTGAITVVTGVLAMEAGIIHRITR